MLHLDSLLKSDIIFVSGGGGKMSQKPPTVRHWWQWSSRDLWSCSMIIYWSSSELRRSPPKKMFFLFDHEMIIDFHQISLKITIRSQPWPPTLVRKNKEGYTVRFLHCKNSKYFISNIHPFFQVLDMIALAINRKFFLIKFLFMSEK